MYCPNCGARSKDDLRFCRVCGFALERVSQLIADSTALSHPTETATQIRQRRVENLGAVALSASGVAFASYVIYSIIAKVIIAQGEVVSGIALLIAIISALIALVFLTYRKTLRKASNAQERDAALLAGEPQPKLKPDDYSRLIPSITENTTRSLDSESRPNAAHREPRSLEGKS